MVRLYIRTQRNTHAMRKFKTRCSPVSQYALYKRMTLAAILIQSRFRSFHEQKKFQQSRRAAVLIQQYYRSYRHSLRYLTSACAHTHTPTRSINYPSILSPLTPAFFADSSLLTKKQNQAARKILRFLLRCRHR